MNKKIFLSLSPFAVALPTISISCNNSDNINIESGLYYKEIDDQIIGKYIEITGLKVYKQEDEKMVPNEIDLVIPATINNIPVKKIASQAFEGLSIKTVKLGENITTIGGFAFANCKLLTKIDLGESKVTIIETGIAKQDNASNNLKEVILPATLHNIGAFAFLNNKNPELKFTVLIKPENQAGVSKSTSLVISPTAFKNISKTATINFKNVTKTEFDEGNNGNNLN
ncbi:UNVERIFIED_CONTAM: leucine-rich repeat protein [Campylobacter lari]